MPQDGRWVEMHRDHLTGPIKQILNGILPVDNGTLTRSLIDHVLHACLCGPRMKPLDSDLGEIV